ncbi:MAG: hypothetical protein JW894_00545 [Bacteroidales bacterium]|nr:hypothetical protein [Bacteroidales bacterium]
MRRRFKVIFIGLLLIPFSIFGQNYINTPYSRYGIGDLMNTGLSYNRSLGGSSIALRPLNQVNYLSPASYTSQDTMSFLFQAGIAARSSLLVTDIDEDRTNNSNIEYLLIGFPISKWWKFSAGIVPYSRIQYLFREYPEITDDIIVIDYKGDGGFNEFYFGTAFEINDYISVGINAGYLFGKLDKRREIYLPEITAASTIVNEKFIASDFYYRFGIQAYKIFWEKHQFIFGLTYDTKTKIDIKQQSFEGRNFPYGYNPGIFVDTFNVVTDSVMQLQMPAKIGIGLSYVLNEQVLMTLEYSQQKFKKAFDKNEFKNIADYSSLRFGAEFTPVPITNRQRASYIERMHYRIGAHYTNTYIKFNNTQITDYGISVGLGLPWRNPKKLYTYSNFNLTYEYGIRGTTENQLIKEKYHIITIGFTLHDFWFHKPKYD